MTPDGSKVAKYVDPCIVLQHIYCYFYYFHVVRVYSFISNRVLDHFAAESLKKCFYYYVAYCFSVLASRLQANCNKLAEKCLLTLSTIKNVAVYVGEQRRSNLSFLQ